MNNAFWRNKRVFVTGHTGFKGSWLCLWLQHLGADVTGYALEAPTNPSLFEAAAVADGMTSIIGDIRDAAKLTAALQQASPELVIHMAAQPLVRHSYQDPVETYSTNVMGLVHLFEAVRQTPGVRALVNVTSDKCYENREWVWGYRENDPMGGYDPYSSSKGCAELVTAAYRRSFFSEDTPTAVASARAGNVIGGGDWAQDRLVPDIIQAFTQGEKVIIRSPEAIRPWQHVLEPLAGYLTLAEHLYDHGARYADGWNFGPSDEDTKSVLWITQTLADQWGNGARYEVVQNETNPHEAQLLKLDCSKARQQLKWQPRWDVTTALKKSAAWYNAFYTKKNMQKFTLEQISDYSSKENPAE